MREKFEKDVKASQSLYVFTKKQKTFSTFLLWMLLSEGNMRFSGIFVICFIEMKRNLK